MITLHPNNDLDSDLISTTILKPSGLSKHPNVTNTTDQGKHWRYILLLNYFCDSREQDLKTLCKDMERVNMYEYVKKTQ